MVHRILEILQEKSYLKEALVVITGDHGEMLGEHGYFSHAKTVRDPALRIPFIMLRYGYVPEQDVISDQIASQVDIAPTIAMEMNMPVPPAWSGEPLQTPSGRRFVQFQQGSEIGLIDAAHTPGPLKFWMDHQSGVQFAYDLSTDPAELTNLAPTVAPDVRATWERALIEAVAAAAHSRQ